MFESTPYAINDKLKLGRYLVSVILVKQRYQRIGRVESHWWQSKLICCQRQQTGIGGNLEQSDRTPGHGSQSCPLQEVQFFRLTSCLQRDRVIDTLLERSHGQFVNYRASGREMQFVLRDAAV